MTYLCLGPQVRALSSQTWFIRLELLELHICYQVSTTVADQGNTYIDVMSGFPYKRKLENCT